MHMQLYIITDLHYSAFDDSTRRQLSINTHVGIESMYILHCEVHTFKKNYSSLPYILEWVNTI